MKLSEYSDDELIEEIKHRGIKIGLLWRGSFKSPTLLEPVQVKIGGVVFELKT